MLFVSSTFKDMHFERDIIHERVTPALNNAARQYGASVSFCDPRRGVNTSDLEREESARKVLSVCLDKREKSVTALEIAYGALSNPEQLNRTLFCFGEIEGEIPETYRQEDERHAAKLRELKERIAKVPSGRIKTYKLLWDVE